MARVTATEVRVILPADTLLTDPQIEAGILAANSMVNRIAVGCASYLGDDDLKQVELYLSAHFCAVTEKTLNIKSEKDGCSESSATYGFNLGEGIKGTPFGQMANTLSGGCLAEYDKTPVGIFSIGCN